MKRIFLCSLVGTLCFGLASAQPKGKPNQEFYNQLANGLLDKGDEVNFPELFSPDELQVSRNSSLLRTLGQYLNNQPEVRVRIVSHTNCHNNKAYNLALSSHRAHLIVKQLADNGIDPSRLEAVGAGSGFPVEACACESCTDAQHQRNERVSVVLIEKMKPIVEEEATAPAPPAEKLIDPKQSVVIMLRACLDEAGNVTEVEYLPESSNRASEALVKKAVEDAKTWKFGPSLSEEPCSDIKYTLPPQG